MSDSYHIKIKLFISSAVYLIDSVNSLILTFNIQEDLIKLLTVREMMNHNLTVMMSKQYLEKLYNKRDEYPNIKDIVRLNAVLIALESCFYVLSRVNSQYGNRGFNETFESTHKRLKDFIAEIQSFLEGESI